MRVAVIGAGIYGCTTAVALARAGHTVDLYERHRGLLHGASRANQGRLHSGYHYPRSPETAHAAMVDADRFAARFPGVVDRTHRQYYAIAARDSLTTAHAYLAFCSRLGNAHRVVDLPFAHGVDVAVSVPEALIDIGKLREQLRRELRAEQVTVHLGVDQDPDRLDHDLIVQATYGRGWPEPLRYEVCETVLVQLGAHLAKRSLVVLDGPFCSLDPVPGGSLHMLYDVTHSVHTASVNIPDIPEHLAGLLDRGPVFTEHNRMDAMLQTARRFLRGVGMPTYHGSLFTVRAVLPDVDATDARPTLVRRDGRVVHVLAGKIDGAITAAGQVVELAGSMVPA